MNIRTHMLLAAILGSLLLPVLHMHVHVPHASNSGLSAIEHAHSHCNHHQHENEALAQSESPRPSHPESEHENCAVCVLIANGAIQAPKLQFPSLIHFQERISIVSEDQAFPGISLCLTARGPPVV